MAIGGEKVRVYLENEHGNMCELDAFVVTVTQKFDNIDVSSFGDAGGSYIPGQASIEMTLVGTGIPEWQSGNDWRKTRRTAKEWKCAFCGNVNPRSAEHCGQSGKHASGCNAPRPFVYD